MEQFSRFQEEPMNRLTELLLRMRKGESACPFFQNRSTNELLSTSGN